MAAAWSAEPEAPLPPPQVVAPAGDYQLAWLTLEKAGREGRDAQFFLAFRGGKLAAVWCVGGQPFAGDRYWADEKTVALTGDSLKGQVKGRTVALGLHPQQFGHYVWALEAKVANGEVTGSYRTRYAPLKADGLNKPVEVAGAVTGRVATEAQWRKDNAPAAGKDWPSYNGPGSANRGPDSDVAIVDDLAQARPVWKAEQSLPGMWGNGCEDRYRTRTCTVGIGGGASSPVVAGGVVYQYYFKPCGVPCSANLPYDARHLKPTEQEIRQEAAKVSPSPLAAEGLIDWYRPYADDIVAAIDAATGKTLWKTTLPDRSGNIQAHKWRAMNPTPTVAPPTGPGQAGGKVFVQGYGGRLYALDAAGGRTLWEHGARSRGVSGACGTASPVVAGSVVVTAWGTFGNGKITAVDIRTGRKAWETPGVNPMVWRSSDGVERLVVFTDKAVRCVSPGDGGTLWSEPHPMHGGWPGRMTGSMALVTGDLLVGFAVPGDAKYKGNGGVPTALRLSATGAKVAWEGEYLAPDENMVVAAARDRAYFVGNKEVRAYALDSGKLLASLKGDQAFTGLHGPGSNSWLAVVGNRVLLSPEGQHGGQAFLLLDLDLKPLSAWHPRNPPDCAYACMALAYPVVDGRWFIRGQDGLYCYDLRKR